MLFRAVIYLKRKIICFCTTLCAVVLLCAKPLLCAHAENTELSLSAQSAVLISADTGTVLYEKNAHTRLSMASTTKILTALLALEAAAENDPIVEITAEMVAVEGSSMGLQAGDKISLKNLAVGMLLASGNDAANSAAIYLAGSQAAFADLMNARAEQLSLDNTHFVTPSGLDDDEHYSTAYDMAQLARAALENDDFKEICSSQQMQVEFTSPQKTVTYYNHNKLLALYDGCTGVKTGYTKKSGRCLVSSAEHSGVSLIAVTLNAPDDWNDHIAMLDYGFANLTTVSLNCTDITAQLSVVGADCDSITVGGGTAGSVTLPKTDEAAVTYRILLPKFLYAPVTAGERIGSVQYYLNGSPLCSVPVYAQQAAQKSTTEKPGIKAKLFKFLN